MVSSLNASLSGLHANAVRVATAANNIANVRSTGPVDQPQRAYQPQVATTEALAGGGVTTKTQTVAPPTTTAYAPDDPNANAEGLVALPNISLENELVAQQTAVIGYKANASAVRVASEMDKTLLDLMV